MRNPDARATLATQKAAWRRLWALLLAPRQDAKHVEPPTEQEAADLPSAAREG